MNNPNNLPVFDTSKDLGDPDKVLRKFRVFKSDYNLRDHQNIIVFYGSAIELTCKEAEDTMLGNLRNPLKHNT